MFKKSTIFVLFMVLVFVLTACGGPTVAATEKPPVEPKPTEAPTIAPEKPTEVPPTEAPKQPVVLRVAVGAGFATRNPTVSSLAVETRLFMLIYERLFEIGLDGAYHPLLAEKYVSSPDGLVWTFTINKGVMWHDGKPLTAKDVAFSFNLFKKYEDFPSMHGYTKHLTKAEATNDSTVVVTLDQALPNIEDTVGNMWIIPEHIWGPLDDGTSKQITGYPNTEMIGSGSFKLVKYKEGEFIRLAANKEHWFRPPKIDELIWMLFNNNDAQTQALVSGQVDQSGIPATAIATLKNDPNIKIVIGQAVTTHLSDIILNQISKENCPTEGGICSGHPALKDLQVRQALAYATDKQKIIDIDLLGLGEPGKTIVASGTEWFNPNLQDYAYDLEKAKQTLEDAGYKDVDNDGVREMPDGKTKLTFRFYIPSDFDTASRIYEVINESWSQIGVKTEFKQFDEDAMIALCNPAFDFDIIFWGWFSDPDPNYLLSVLTTEQITSFNSETGYSNPEYDDLFNQQAKELDHAKRMEMVFKMQEILLRDAPYIIPYYDQAWTAYRVDKFTGWPDPDKGERLAPLYPAVMTRIEPVK